MACKTQQFRCQFVAAENPRSVLRNSEINAIYMDNLPFMSSEVGDKEALVKSEHVLIRLRVIDEASTNGNIDPKYMGT